MTWNIFILSWPSSLKYTSNKINEIIKMWEKYQTNVERHLSTMKAKSINQSKFLISAQQNVWPHVLPRREPWVEAHDRNTAVRLWFGYESIKGNIDYTRKNILGCMTFLDSFIKIPSLRYIWKKGGGKKKSQKYKLAKNIWPWSSPYFTLSLFSLPFLYPQLLATCEEKYFAELEVHYFLQLMA